MGGINTHDLFVKVIMGGVPKIFLQLWFACNICQCFVSIYFKFGNARVNIIFFTHIIMFSRIF